MDIDLSDVKSSDTVPLTVRDRNFFTHLNRFMNDESAKAGETATKERFAIFRLAFEKIIDKSFLYRPLFRAIKQEYEQCIAVLESGAEEVDAMSADLHRLVLEPKTFLLRQKRCMELEDKLAIIEQENKQLEQEIAKLLAQKKSNEPDSIKKTVSDTDTLQQPQTGHRRIPGLTFAEETDFKALEKYHDFLREKHLRLEENASTKYTIKEKRTEMQSLFEQKLSDLDKESEQRLTLRNRLRLYHLAWRSIRKFIEEKQTSSSMRMNSTLLEDVVMNAIYESSNMFSKGIQDDDDDLEGGSFYDKEAGMLLDHIEIFMDMIQKGNYKEASYIAACSPKGVLRNMETLLKFKALKKPLNEEISPWLFHCKVLAETALEAQFVPDAIMSLECAKAACSENQLELLYKWIAEERLTCSFEMAELVERSNALNLAEFIYRKVNAYCEVASCLLQTESSKRCLDYLTSVANLIPSLPDLLTKLFDQYPSVKFAVDIVNYTPEKYLQADELVLLFLQLDQHVNAIQFVEQLIQEKGKNCEKQEAEKLQTCFDLLKKYSYLADDKTSSSSSSSPITNADEHSNPLETEQELAHRLTRRITRSALERFRRARRCSSTNSITLEPIQEHPTPTSPTPPSPSEPSLCHQDFFNDFPGKLYFSDDVELKKDDLQEMPDE
ncbi:unnamed protein product [Rotaria socialis]|uniref:Translin-associated factor X-interacting protein 1 N-terminal domain-containing protein n=1 Tax=Rotaria socialis TaxID=392032 RepID=A0A817SXU8_9BILA|nr:unnamed protein product [Rotaria socialis]CAF3443090.1 unnamed protein product [Rotaria socialis]CAF4160879.1 unnamed protein product [Rotaria socialis]CAF4186129.1 unnamed protein product [Rotaria socialis]